MTSDPAGGPTIALIRAARLRLGEHIRTTPVWEWRGPDAVELFGPTTRVFAKLELFQYAGTFKPRGALLNMLALDDESLSRGVTAVSAGNHALAVGYAATTLGTSAKVVMPRSANAARIAGCKALGVEVVLVDNVHDAFATVRQIERDEERAFIHPFEGPQTVLGTATVGLELMDECPELDAVVIPIGGGGLCAGVASAVKRVRPGCRIIGVEPCGADAMHRSFAAGSPQALERIATIADSLGAPHTEPYTFSLCWQYVDELVLVDDEALRRTMIFMFENFKLAVEPAGAAATAAVCGPLRERLAGQSVGVVVCGSNIDTTTYQRTITPTG